MQHCICLALLCSQLCMLVRCCQPCFLSQIVLLKQRKHLSQTLSWCPQKRAVSHAQTISKAVI